MWLLKCQFDIQHKAVSLSSKDMSDLCRIRGLVRTLTQNQMERGKKRRTRAKTKTISSHSQTPSFLCFRPERISSLSWRRLITLSDMKNIYLKNKNTLTHCHPALLLPGAPHSHPWLHYLSHCLYPPPLISPSLLSLAPSSPHAPPASLSSPMMLQRAAPPSASSEDSSLEPLRLPCPSPSWPSFWILVGDWRTSPCWLHALQKNWSDFFLVFSFSRLKKYKFCDYWEMLPLSLDDWSVVLLSTVEMGQSLSL